MTSKALPDRSKWIGGLAFATVAAGVFALWPRGYANVPWSETMTRLAHEEHFEVLYRNVPEFTEIRGARDGNRVAQDRFSKGRLQSHLRFDGQLCVSHRGDAKEAWKYHTTTQAGYPVTGPNDFFRAAAWDGDEPIYEEAERTRNVNGVLQAVLQFRRVYDDLPPQPDRFYIRLEPGSFRVLSIERRVDGQTVWTYEISRPRSFPPDRFAPVPAPGVALRDGVAIQEKAKRFLWSGVPQSEAGGRRIEISNVIQTQGRIGYLFVRVKGTPLASPPEARITIGGRTVPLPRTARYGATTAAVSPSTDVTYYGYTIALPDNVPLSDRPFNIEVRLGSGRVSRGGVRAMDVPWQVPVVEDLDFTY